MSCNCWRIVWCIGHLDILQRMFFVVAPNVARSRIQYYSSRQSLQLAIAVARRNIPPATRNAIFLEGMRLLCGIRTTADPGALVANFPRFFSARRVTPYFCNSLQLQERQFSTLRSASFWEKCSVAAPLVIEGEIPYIHMNLVTIRWESCDYQLSGLVLLHNPTKVLGRYQFPPNPVSMLEYQLHTVRDDHQLTPTLIQC